MASWHGSSIFFQSEARCGKAVCQSIDFSSPEFFAPAPPHLFSGHYVGVPCMRISAMYVERMSPGGWQSTGSIPGTDNAPQQLLTRPFYCLYSVLSAFSGAAPNIHHNTTTQYTPQYTLQYTRQPNIHDNITAVDDVLLQNCRTPSPSNAVAFDLVFCCKLRRYASSKLQPGWKTSLPYL